MPNMAWVDTGFLVALFAKNDKHHASALRWLKRARDVSLCSLWPVVVEACFLLDSRARRALLEWLESGAIHIFELALTDLSDIRIVLKKYSNLDPDFTDAALVALAQRHHVHRIVTVDVRDFSAYRLAGGRCFERLWL